MRNLYGKYKGVLLVAVAQDSNQNILPVAVVIVKSKDYRCMAFFLDNLSRYVVIRVGVDIISDHHKSINATIRRSNSWWELPKAFHMYCIRHITANFLQRFKVPYLHKLVVSVGN